MKLAILSLDGEAIADPSGVEMNALTFRLPDSGPQPMARVLRFDVSRGAIEHVGSGTATWITTQFGEID